MAAGNASVHGCRQVCWSGRLKFVLRQSLVCSPTHGNLWSAAPQVTFTKLETGHLPAREQREDEIRAFRKKQVGSGDLRAREGLGSEGLGSFPHFISVVGSLVSCPIGHFPIQQ